MAETNGHNAVTAEMVEVLKQIRDEMRGGFQEVRAEMREGFRAVNGRLDNIIATMGETARDHEARIAKLETGMARLSAGPRRPPAR